MSIPHFFLDTVLEVSPGQNIEFVPGKDVMDHLGTLRLKADEKLIFADKPGRGWLVQLTADVEKRKGTIQIKIIEQLNQDHDSNLTLVQGISASDRMDLIIRQATELGVGQIVPLMSERSIVRMDSKSQNQKRQRWQRIARSAAEQSGSLYLSDIAKPCKLEQALSLIEDCDLILVFWEEEGGCSITEAFEHLQLGQKKTTRGDATLNNGAAAHASSQSLSEFRCAIIVGPEGGFSTAEVDTMLCAKAKLVSMGKKILRSETAATVACALCLYQLGGLGAKLG